MPSEAAFRLSVYLSLALACTALGYAEHELLPEAGLVATAVVIALVVLYRLETRVELLSISAANRLGLLLGLGNLLWAAFRMLQEINSSEHEHMDWPVLGLALIGPLVMTLMPAKLARREKHAGDYWWLYGLALSTAALAGAMAEDFIAFLLIGLFACCTIWSLCLFHLRLAGGAIRPVPGHAPEVAIVSAASEGQSRAGIGEALGLAALAALLATPLYLVTPRSTFERLEFGKPRVEIGYSADQMIDLTKTGNLEANQETAFEVLARSATGAKVRLSPDQRWKGRTLRAYRSGVWQEGDFRLPALDPGPRGASPWAPPSIGTKPCTLTFALPAGARGRFLADPVVWAANAASPIATITGGGYLPWIWTGSGSFISEARVRSASGPLRYVQAWDADLDPDLSPPFRLIDPDREAILRPLRDYRVARVKEYADGLIEGLVRIGKLPANYADPVSLLPRPEFHDLIARSFSAHLATTPTLKYTTDLRREMKEIDPVEEFLFHTRSGHCERFASALVLLLRSQGIPAMLVLGFKGCEPVDDTGRYRVRQEHAHAWVEALIERYEPVPWWGYRLPSRWRSLDPTPAGTQESIDEPWNRRAGSWLRNVYKSYLGTYTPEQRERALKGLVDTVSRVDVLVVVAIACLLVVLRRHMFGRRRTIRSRDARWFERLHEVLAPHGIIPQPGETPKEYAERAAGVLRENAVPTPVAETPSEWTGAHYEARFGGAALTPERIHSLEARLDELRAALSKREILAGETR